MLSIILGSTTCISSMVAAIAQHRICCLKGFYCICSTLRCMSLHHVLRPSSLKTIFCTYFLFLYFNTVHVLKIQSIFFFFFSFLFFCVPLLYLDYPGIYPIVKHQIGNRFDCFINIIVYALLYYLYFLFVFSYPLYYHDLQWSGFHLE